MFGCKADVQRLEGRVPSGMKLGELLNTEVRFFVCQRASYQLEHVEEHALTEFSLLDGLYSSSFLSCVTGDELRFWQNAAARKSLIHFIDDNPQGEFHFWVNLETNRILIMQLAT